MDSSKKIPTVLVAVLASAVAIGCAGTNPAAKQDNAQYEYVMQSGSNIPVRVRKGEASGNAVTGDAAQRLISPETANSQARSGGGR